MFSTCQPARVCVRSGPAEAFSTSFASTSSCRTVIVTGVYVDTVQLMYSKMSASLAARWPVSMLLLLVITVAAVSASPMKRAVRPLPDNNVDQFDALPDKVNNSERCLGITRAVLTNGHTGHVPRAPGFFFLRGAQGPNAGKDGTGQH